MLRLTEFLIFKSSLFYSDIAEGKTRVLKIIFLHWFEEIYCCIWHCKLYSNDVLNQTRKPMAWRLVTYHFFLNRAVLAWRWALNQESTLIRGGMGRIIWDGRFSWFFFFFFFGRMTSSPMVLSFRSSKANTTNVSNIAGFLPLP